jgi:hypothetical protein
MNSIIVTAPAVQTIFRKPRVGVTAGRYQSCHRRLAGTALDHLFIGDYFKFVCDQVLKLTGRCQVAAVLGPPVTSVMAGESLVDQISAGTYGSDQIGKH